MSYIEKFWRDATDKDVVDVMNDKEVEARFTQNNGSTRKGFVAGWKETPAQWMDSHGLFWDRCQVYDPPQWYLDKPEPEDGFRLLEKFPDEAKLVTDEVYLKDIQHWQQIGVDDGKQQEGYWYRRRIEPKPEPKYAVGQRVRIVGPKERPAASWDGHMDRYIGREDVVGRVHPYGPKSIFFHLEGIKERDFREDYLEAVVEPEPKHYSLRVGDTCDVPSGQKITIHEDGYSVT